jgi:hypothetical protein
MIDLTEEEKKAIVDIIDGTLDAVPEGCTDEAVLLTTILRKLDRIDLADEWAIEFNLP